MQSHGCMKLKKQFKRATFSQVQWQMEKDMEKKTFCTKSRTQVFIIDSRTSNANVNATLDTRGDLWIRMNLDNNLSHPVVHPMDRRQQSLCHSDCLHMKTTYCTMKCFHGCRIPIKGFVNCLKWGLSDTWSEIYFWVIMWFTHLQHKNFTKTQ